MLSWLKSRIQAKLFLEAAASANFAGLRLVTGAATSLTRVCQAFPESSSLVLPDPEEPEEQVFCRITQQLRKSNGTFASLHYLAIFRLPEATVMI